MRWSKRKGMKHGYLVENVGIGQQGLDTRVGAIACGPALHFWAGHDGIRHSRRGARGHCDPGHHGVSPETPRALERHCRWHQRTVSRLLGRSGQATVEFAVIAAGFLVVTVALMALWRVLGDGLLVQHALAVASHHLQLVAPVVLVDVFLY